MMEMKEQTGSRKKYLAPVVVLMLCLVALTGAAYAYSSTLTVESNSVDADYLSIDLATGTPATDITPVANPGAIVFTDDHVYQGATAKNTVSADVTTMKIITYALKVSTDTTFDTVKVSSDNIATLLGQTIGSTTAGALFKIYVSDNVNGTGTNGMKELNAAGQTFTVTQTGATTSVSIYVFVVAVDSGVAQTTVGDHVSSEAQEEYTVSNPDTKNAQSLQALFSGAGFKFNITFEAYKA